MYLQFLIFPVAVSPFSGSLGVGFLALQTAIDFLLDLALRKFLPALWADFGNALRGLHVLHIGLNRRVVSVHCHVLPVSRPSLLGGYGAQGEIVRFLAHSDLPPLAPLIGYNVFDLVVAFICCYKSL